jgi:SET domain-containing protein
VCAYEGERLSLSQLLERYASETPVYVYRLSATWSIDARNSTHVSRYINHDARPNLQVIVSKAEQRIDIFAKRPLRVGTELTIDYVRHALPQPFAAHPESVQSQSRQGLSYWRARTQTPEAGTDPRLR